MARAAAAVAAAMGALQGFGVPLGSMTGPSPARTCVVVFIFASSGRRLAVGVQPHPLPGGELRRDGHPFLLSRRSGRWCCSPRRAGAWSRSSRLGQGVGSPLGSMPQPLPAGRCVVTVIVVSSGRGVAVGVDPPAAACGELRGDGHVRLLRGWAGRWDRCRPRCRRGGAWWCSSEFPFRVDGDACGDVPYIFERTGDTQRSSGGMSGGRRRDRSGFAG